ncbi:uncharacterized protein LOC119103585 [Pollicipes pollicipes]|uniref:uncharacterized protein LOC119103585 n=1 Tax=Pollicipes pollicipes TaxID=41117 RepID=UPI00188497B0|nr:uncharacterized protein LOC119103585 [Pollicipes pollicipes]
MAGIKVLLLLASLLAAVRARPQDVQSLFSVGPSPVYSYRFEGPEQSKEESRDVLGNIQGSYSVKYPNNGGTLVYSYAHPARQPVFRTTAEGPLGPAGTIIAFGKNSKDNAFLIEMLEQRLDSREPPVVTKTEAVLIEALPEGDISKPSTSVEFRPGGGDTGNKIDENQPSDVTRQEGPFVNSKESTLLPVIRKESLLNEPLGARNPPIIGVEEIIVEASDV